MKALRISITAAFATAALASAAFAQGKGIERLYILECGQGHTGDMSRWTPGQNVNVPKDVFGDGSATIISTPGHTPGHQSLLVKLRKTGARLLTGDAVHFQSNWEGRIVPGFNFDQAKSATSMTHMADILAKEHGEIWINH